MRIDLEVKNVTIVNQQLDEFDNDVQSAVGGALDEIGRYVESEQKDRAPISPTKDQARGSSYSYNRGAAPGTLEESCQYIKGRDYIEVGVMFGPALDYAFQMNYGHYNLGPGSLAKSTGEKIGRRFVERAYEDNEGEIHEVFADEVNTAVDRINRRR